MIKTLVFSYSSYQSTMQTGMRNFNYANITRIVFGKGQIAKLPTLIPPEKKVLLTYGGGSIKRNGVYDQVKKALEGYEVMEFGGIEANPDFDTLMKAVRIIKTLDMSRVYLLSVGGGSVCDGTKLIAAACFCETEEDAWKIVYTHGCGITKALPIGCIMTLPAVRYMIVL